MRHRLSITLVLLSTCVLAGCATTAPPGPAPAGAPAATTVATGAPVPPGQLRVTGAVRVPDTWTSDRLARLPRHTVAVTFGTDRGPESHSETGVPLSALLDQAGLLPVPGVKHSELSAGVLVIGADGYRALVSYGEIAPAFGNRDVLLATVQDGQQLARPRLVVPGDVKGGRDVRDVVEVHVINAASG
jgi:DMSO/TMAO reductase YedYZ molybdopterin-dependent catalytic subunit